MVNELKENPFRKPEERVEFFKKLVQQNPTSQWIKDVAKNSPAAAPAGVMNPQLVEQTAQQEAEQDREANNGSRTARGVSDSRGNQQTRG